jgi:putative flippase GtrA
MKKQIHLFLTNKEHPLLQFIKYGLCGGLATVVDVTVFFLFTWLVFPALGDADPFADLLRFFGLEVQTVSDAVRSRNFVIDSMICFVFSNLTAYILNVLFVFKAGKHKRHHELMLFYVVSIVSLVLATFAGWLLITVFGLSTTWSYAAKMVFALLINYAGRKYFIFHG